EVAPGLSPPVGAFGGVFPFRFRRQPIFSAFTGAEPLAKLHRIQTADINNGMPISGRRRAFTLVKGIEGFVMRVRDRKTRYVKATDSNAEMRGFVWRRFRKRIAHDECPRWHKKHLTANRTARLDIPLPFLVDRRHRDRGDARE